jgi:hypothetical protein
MAMFAVTLCGFAAAVCVLPVTIDPNSACVEDANGFSTLDADSDSDVPISLAITTKSETTDAFSVVHPATAGTLTDDTASDGRYILACPQAAGKKTVQLTVTRPADITAFGGEWVQLFPKDSWSNATNEYEPFTFNEYGAKIPLPELRPTSELSTDAANAGVLHVFMEVSGEGDFEVKYGNPTLVSGGKWVAVEFKSTLLRVGAPWADCSGDVLPAPTYTLGSIMPILFGGPNLNSIALAEGSASYLDAIADLSGVSVPVKVVLEIFSPDKTTYTSSTVDGQCYKAGNACPEAHSVCKAEYCEMDVWASIIANFKAASPGQVTVLGAATGIETSAYAGLSVDGFYQTSEPTPPWDFLGIGYCGYQADGNGNYQTNGGTAQLTPYFKAVSGWYMMKADCQAYCEAASWCQAFQILNYQCPALGVPGTTPDGSAFVPPSEVICDPDSESGTPTNSYHGRATHGSCGLFLKVGTDVNTVTAPAAAPGKSWQVRDWGSPILEVNVGRRGTHDGMGCHKKGSGTPAGTAMVSAIGAPLFDETAVDDATVYVTLAAKDIGIWSPFSWYPSVPPTKWAAMVTEATDTSAVATLVDRGYGWVYLTSETGFETKSSMTPAVLTAIENVGTTRRLKDRRLEASAPAWGCDDTLFECKPICIRTQGVVSTKVSDSLCAAAPKDVCACKCYHDAQWTCDGDKVICKAKFGAGELQIVGDKLCETRGAPKPVSTAELRVASTCEPMTEMRGSAPTEQCLVQWGTPEPTEAPATEVTPTALATVAPAAEEQEVVIPTIDESVAATLAFVALALYA